MLWVTVVLMSVATKVDKYIARFNKINVKNILSLNKFIIRLKILSLSFFINIKPIICRRISIYIIISEAKLLVVGIIGYNMI